MPPRPLLLPVLRLPLPAMLRSSPVMVSRKVMPSLSSRCTRRKAIRNSKYMLNRSNPPIRLNHKDMHRLRNNPCSNPSMPNPNPIWATCRTSRRKLSPMKAAQTTCRSKTIDC